MRKFDIGEGLLAAIIGGCLAVIPFSLVTAAAWGWPMNQSVHRWVQIGWLWAPAFFYLGGRAKRGHIK